ncbi:MAG: hypothetical protein H0T48_00460 [Gemmatimonadaceae bacterium]|nr:hypothetical protein [Gemmatimonadaceae bacterium]
MAADIAKKYPQAAINLTPSSGGRFEVLRDGVPVFRKSWEKRHAKPGEILALLAEIDMEK